VFHRDNPYKYKTSPTTILHIVHCNWRC